jgi:hypothetical protein
VADFERIFGRKAAAKSGARGVSFAKTKEGLVLRMLNYANGL